MKIKTLSFIAGGLMLAGTAFGANSLAVNNNAAMGGVGGTACSGGPCGLEIILDGSNNPARVVDETPNGESIYRAQFYVNMNNLVQTEGPGNFWAMGRGTKLPEFKASFQFLVIKKFNQWRFFLRGQTNASTDRFTGRIDVPDADGRAPMLFQVTFTQSPAPGTPGGEVELCLLQGGGGVQGTCVKTADIFGEGINNSNLAVDNVLFGGVGNLGAFLNGSFYFDEFASFRTVAAQ